MTWEFENAQYGIVRTSGSGFPDALVRIVKETPKRFYVVLIETVGEGSWVYVSNLHGGGWRGKQLKYANKEHVTLIDNYETWSEALLDLRADRAKYAIVKEKLEHERKTWGAMHYEKVRVSLQGFRDLMWKRLS